MKTRDRVETPPRLVGEVHLARICLAKAENQLATAREKSRLARRRRKEAKLAARRAKKRARQAKKELAEAKLALAQAEDNLARVNQRPFKIKPRAKPLKQSTTATRRKRNSSSVGVRRRASAKRTKPAVRATKRPVTIPREIETPGVLASSSDSGQMETVSHPRPGEFLSTPNETIA